MNINEQHAAMVSDLARPGNEIAEAMTPEKAHLIHMMAGVCGEAGELLDTIKKHFAYGKPLDLENVVEELGDIEFYLQGLRQGLQESYGLTLNRDEILDANMTKLRKRYPAGHFDAQDAMARADKE